MLRKTWVGLGGWVGCNDIVEVAHMFDEMSPVVSLNKRKMTPGQIATLKKAAQARRKSPASAIEKKTCFNVIGGDNATESEVARTNPSCVEPTHWEGKAQPHLMLINSLLGACWKDQVWWQSCKAWQRTEQLESMRLATVQQISWTWTMIPSWLYAWRYGKGEKKKRMQTCKNVPFVR